MVDAKKQFANTVAVKKLIHVFARTALRISTVLIPWFSKIGAATAKNVHFARTIWL